MTTTEKTKREQLYERIRQHGENLLRIFPRATEQDPVALCKKLRRLELEGERLAVAYCNGEIESENYERRSELLLKRVNRTLGNVSVPVFHNGDPRGYALKIRDEYTREHDLQIHRDWGGYGIIAPDLTEGE